MSSVVEQVDMAPASHAGSSTSHLAPVAPRQRMSAQIRKAYGMLACMVSVAILSQFYRSSNGVIAPNLMADLGLSAENIGLLSSAFFVVFACLQIPVGILLDRFGARLVICSMLVLAIVGSLIFAWGQSFSSLFLGRFLIGIGCAPAMVGSLVILSRWFGPDRYAFAMAILFGFANAGSLAAAGPLAGATHMWGWRTAFVGLAAMTALLMGLFYLFVRDAPRDHPYHDRVPETLAATIAGLRKVWAIRDAILILPMVAIGYSSVITVLGLWGGPYFYDVHGLGDVARGEILSAMAIAMIAGTFFYGPLDRKFGTRRRVVTIGALATIAPLALLAMWPAPPLWMAGLLLSLFCFFGAYSVVVMAHGLALFPEGLRGRGVTMLNLGLMGGAALLQAATGPLIGAFPDPLGGSTDLAYQLLFALIALITLGALVVYRMVRDIGPGE